MKTLKYFHLIIGILGLIATLHNMAATGDITGNFSSLLSSILFIVIAYRIKFIISLFSKSPQH